MPDGFSLVGTGMRQGDYTGVMSFDFGCRLQPEWEHKAVGSGAATASWTQALLSWAP